MSPVPLQHVLNQIEAARCELESYRPAQIDWVGRSRSTAMSLVPWLAENSSELKNYLTRVMNSPHDVRQLVKRLHELLDSIPDDSRQRTLKRLKKQLDQSLERERLLLRSVGGTVISKLIEDFLIGKSVDWQLESNGASDYPDLFLRSKDYSKLPKFRRGTDQVYGAAVKGNEKRPVRVPDGLEVKTCRNRFAVDCHHAHAGLHLAVLYEKVKAQFVVKDILVAYMYFDLYRITKPATPTTTLKASFSGDHFVSLIYDVD